MRWADRILLVKRVTISFLAALAVAAQSAVLPRGSDRLRELAVVPQVKMSFEIGTQNGIFPEDYTEEGTIEDWIEQARQKSNEETDNLQAHLQLGRLLNAKGDTNAARLVFEKGTILGRHRLEQRPNDGLNLSLLAGMVLELGDEEEAESFYRRATMLASNDWHCWVGLGELLRNQSFSSLGLSVPTNNSLEKSRPKGTAAQSPLLKELDKSIKLRDEASICFQRAYGVAPGEFEVLVRQGRYLSFSNWHATLVQRYQNEQTLSSKELALSFFDMFFSPKARPDYEKALAVRPQCRKLLTMLVFAEWTAAMKAAEGLESSHPLTLDQLPEKTRKAILDSLQRLEALGNGPDKKIAAAALTSLSVLKMQMRDADNLPAYMQRAVALDPTNEQAWDMLIGMSVNQVSPEKFTELCERRLKKKETPRNYLIVAKAMFRQERFKEAEQYAALSNKMDKNYAPTALMLATLAIRRDFLVGAKAFLLQAGKAIDRLTDEDEVDGRRREMALNLAIVFALENESVKARGILEKLLKRDEEDKVARDILNALP